MKRLALAIGAVVLTAASLQGQGPGAVDPATLSRPATTSWPTYNGDYSGRRFSTLTQINTDTVK